MNGSDPSWDTVVGCEGCGEANVKGVECKRSGVGGLKESEEGGEAAAESGGERALTKPSIWGLKYGFEAMVGIGAGWMDDELADTPRFDLDSRF